MKGKEKKIDNDILLRMYKSMGTSLAEISFAMKLSQDEIKKIMEAL